MEIGGIRLDLIVLAAGVLMGVPLIGMLIWTHFSRSFRLWPTPGPKTWQSYVFWPLFRSLNVLAFAAALAGRSGFLGLSPAVRGVALAGLVASLGTFIYSLLKLGKENSYCGTEGLVIDGVYRWTRNPQYVMLFTVYACLAIAADNGPTWLLAGAVILTYYLMAVVEEPWLAGVYGEPYRTYCRQVPRFLSWRTAAAAARRH